MADADYMIFDNIYNQFTTEYNDLYLENIRQFQKSSEQTEKNIRYIDFYPSFGITKSEACDFLVYGQAVNGWPSEFLLKENVSLDKIEKSKKASNGFLATENHCPLDWVNVQWTESIFNAQNDEIKKSYKPDDYWTFRSFFWNVTYKLISEHYKDDNDMAMGWKWAKKMVWSNLYKINQKGRNPNGEERLLQQPLSYKLVKREIEELKPKYCIVITNDEWWAPFRNALPTIQIKKKQLPDKIVSLEQFNQTKIIVTSRPRFGASDIYVKQILEVMNHFSV